MTTSTAPTESGDLRVAGSAVPAEQAPADVLPVDLAHPAPADLAPVDPALLLVDPDRRSPGRPRSALADQAIVEAVLDLLAEDGATIEALSMEAVASRAGVGKATIYRRWSNKESLVVDAMTALKGPLPEVTGESLREDMLLLLRPMATARTTRAGRIMPCLIPELKRNPEMADSYHRLTEPRRELMRSVLRTWIEAGVLRPDIDIDATCAMFTGPIISQTMLSSNPNVDVAKLPEQIVDTLLPGLLAHPLA